MFCGQYDRCAILAVLPKFISVASEIQGKTQVMFDLYASIIPGQSAAGVCLGNSISKILEYIQPQNTVRLHGGGIRYEFGSVSLWDDGDGRIHQIAVYTGYQGTLAGTITIGSTLEELQKAIGKFREDKETNSLAVESLFGWSFEAEDYLKSRQVAPDPTLKITEMYVFHETIERSHKDISAIQFHERNEHFEEAFTNMSPKLLFEMKQLVARCQKIEAIKCYREWTHASLAEAKYIVGKLESSETKPIND